MLLITDVWILAITCIISKLKESLDILSPSTYPYIPTYMYIRIFLGLTLILSKWIHFAMGCFLEAKDSVKFDNIISTRFL